jgi:hypothetical protein
MDTSEMRVAGQCCHLEVKDLAFSARFRTRIGDSDTERGGRSLRHSSVHL